MENLNLTARKILTFIPAGLHYNKAIQFYKEIGFTIDNQNEAVALVRKDECRFLLQNYQNEWALGNFMMVLEVANLDDWWKFLIGLDLPKKCPGVWIKAPEMYPWGKREVQMADVCGVLWHIS